MNTQKFFWASVLFLLMNCIALASQDACVGTLSIDHDDIEPVRIDNFSSIQTDEEDCTICLDPFAGSDDILSLQCETHRYIENQEECLESGISTEERNNDLLKSICAQTSSGHYFHGECIKNWLSNHSTCPICKQIVKGKRSQRSSIETPPAEGFVQPQANRAQAAQTTNVNAPEQGERKCRSVCFKYSLPGIAVATFWICKKIFDLKEDDYDY